MKLLKELTKLTEGTSPAFGNGNYVVRENFYLGLGAWRVTFKKGALLKVTGDKVKMYNAVKGEWINKKPPVQGKTDFDLESFRIVDAQTLVSEFKANVKKISFGQMEEMIGGAVKSKVMTVSKAYNFLDSLQKNQEIKITIV